MSSLEVRKVNKNYRKQAVLSDISFRIDAGEFLVVLGPSGSGKSTLLNIIAGLTSPNAGHILIGDKDVTLKNPSSRNIAMVFQSYGLYPNLSAIDNIAFPLIARGVSRREAEVRSREVADRLDIVDILGRKPSQLSGGQQQRVALGRALVRPSSMILLDEPLSGLDTSLRGEVRSQLKNIHQVDQKTIICVTHDPSEALVLADKIAVIHSGKIVQFSNPHELYNRPLTLAVARLGSVRPINEICGVIQRGINCLRFETADWSINLSQHCDRWVSAIGGDAIIAFRPEDVSIGGPEHSEGIKGRIIRIEYTGPEHFIIIDSLYGNLAARWTDPSFRFSRGDLVTFCPDQSKISLFEADHEFKAY